jgi:hypothetical protein
MFAPTIPNRAPSTVPTPNDPAMQAAERAQLAQQGQAYGRAQTVLTRGMGDVSTPTIAKKSLLGQ